ncbi:MAG: bestrophin family ion channel [Bacteroidota bacterium]
MINYDNKAWLKQLFAWKGTVLWGILPRIIFFMGWTTLIVYCYEHGMISKNIKIDMVVYNVVGLALGLLLVFRTNTSYDRYWEGRKLAGANVNASRNLALLINNIILKEDKLTRLKFRELIISFNYAVKEKLREGVKKEHLPYLRQEFLDIVMKSTNVPTTILQLVHEQLKEVQKTIPYKEYEFLSINNELGNLINNLGGMERIRVTPVPFAYASHLQLFIMLYFLSFPFGLYEKFQWLSVPVIGIVALILLGINEIGVEIEDPFGDDPNDLPMDTICEGIDKSVTEILK